MTTAVVSGVKSEMIYTTIFQVLIYNFFFFFFCPSIVENITLVNMNFYISVQVGKLCGTSQCKVYNKASILLASYRYVLFESFRFEIVSIN